MRQLIFAIFLLFLGTNARAQIFQKTISCSDSDYIYGRLTPEACDKAKEKRASDAAAAQTSNQKKVDSDNREVAKERASYDASHPEQQPNQQFLSGFTGWPIAKRLDAYQRMHLITERDFGDLSPMDQQSIRCMTVAEKIDIQRSYEKIGSHGVYNMDSLKRAGPKSCAQFIETMASLRD